jgi:hypothetical protein
MAMGTGTGAPHFFCTFRAASCQSGFSRKMAQMFSGFEGGAVAQPASASNSSGGSKSRVIGGLPPEIGAGLGADVTSYRDCMKTYRGKSSVPEILRPVPHAPGKEKRPRISPGPCCRRCSQAALPDA